MDAIYVMVISVVQERAQIFISYLDGLLLRRYTKKRSLLIIMKHNEKEKRERIKNDKKNVYIYKGDGKRVPLYIGALLVC